MQSSASVAAQRRDAVLEPICDHVLEHGFEASNLRALARAAGTSNRMLLYYFADKDELLAAAMTRLAERLAERLADQTPNAPMTPTDLADALWAAAQRPELWPYLVLMIEIVARSGRTGEPYASASKAIAAEFLDWISSRLAVENESDRYEAAQEVLALVDGRALLKMAMDGQGRKRAAASPGNPQRKRDRRRTAFRSHRPTGL